MEESKICNFDVKDKQNFSFTKYIKKDDKIKIIKYEEKDGQLKIYKESNGKKFYDKYDLNDKIQVIKYEINKHDENDQKYSKYNEN